MTKNMEPGRRAESFSESQVVFSEYNDRAISSQVEEESQSLRTLEHPPADVFASSNPHQIPAQTQTTQQQLQQKSLSGTIAPAIILSPPVITTTAAAAAAATTTTTTTTTTPPSNKKGRRWTSVLHCPRGIHAVFFSFPLAAELFTALVTLLLILVLLFALSSTRDLRILSVVVLVILHFFFKLTGYALAIFSTILQAKKFSIFVRKGHKNQIESNKC